MLEDISTLLDRYFSVQACEKEVDQLRTKLVLVVEACALLCYSLRVSRATAAALFSLRGYPHISLSLFLFPSLSRRIFRSSSPTSIHSGEYYVWATSMDTCNSLVSSVRILLNSFVHRDSIHVGIVLRLPCLFNLDELSSLVTDQMDFPFSFRVVLLSKKRVYCFFSLSLFFFFILFLYALFFSDITLDQKMED